jgi:MFS family permease
VVTASLISLGAGLFLPYVNVYFTQELGASPAVYGWLEAAGTAARLGATLLAPRLVARTGEARAVAWTQLSSVPLLLTLGFAPNAALAGAAYLLRGAAMNMAAPVQASFTMAALPPRTRGSGNAAIWLASNAARGISTYAGGWLIAAAGYRLPYLATAACYVTSSLLFLWWFGRHRNATAMHLPHPDA